MTDQITLGEALELVTFDQDVDGTWYVTRVHGDVEGDVEGNVGGDVEGYVHGNVEGSVLGNVEGNVLGNVIGNVEGNVEGYVGGFINGREWQYVETPKDRLKRLIEEGAATEKLIKAFNQLEDN